MILSRTRPSLFIPVITFGWGSVAALLGVVQHESHLIALRFLLGVFEAGFSVSHLKSNFPKGCTPIDFISHSLPLYFSSQLGTERASSMYMTLLTSFFQLLI